MAIELITGRAGAPHVDSADVGAFNAAMFGGGVYVVEGCEATLTDANHVRVSAGELLCEGRHVRITGSGETLAIDNGLSGYNRNDIVAMRYERNSSDIETCSLVVVKGSQDTGAAQDTPMPSSGKLLDGASSVYWPLYRIVVDGLTPQTPVFIAQRQALYQLGLGTEIPAGADLNDYVAPGVYYTVNTASVQNAPNMSGVAAQVIVEKVSSAVVRQTVKRAWYNVDDVNEGGTSFTRHIATDSGVVKEWVCTSGIDSIVAEGNTGLWHWRKYANGKCEMFGQESRTSTSSGWVLYGVNFPFTVYGCCGSICYAQPSNIQSQVGWTNFGNTAANFYANTNGGTAVFAYHFVGFWR